MRGGFRSSLFRDGFVYEGAWASIPAATAVRAGDRAWVSDIGTAGSVWISDGATRWYPLNGGVTLFSNAIPMALPSSGSIGNNGALSGLTALPATYANAYLYFPANAIAAGVAAGLYYCVMSSTTAGTIYNNTYTNGTPTIPANPTAFSTTGPGAYTQTTGSALTVLSYTVLGNVMGINGGLRESYLQSYNSSTGSKTWTSRYGGTVLRNTSSNTSGQIGAVGIVVLRNRGVANSQVFLPIGASGASNALVGVNQFLAINSAVDQAFIWTYQLNTATDFQVLESVTLELLTP